MSETLKGSCAHGHPEEASLTGNTFACAQTHHQLQHSAVQEIRDGLLAVRVQFQHLLHGPLRLTVPLKHTNEMWARHSAV